MINLKIYYRNISGIKTKLKDVYNEILINNILLLTEPWLNKGEFNSEICDLNKYPIYRRDRSDNNKSQGGVAILIATRLKSKVQHIWYSSAEIYRLVCSQTIIKKYIFVVPTFHRSQRPLLTKIILINCVK